VKKITAKLDAALAEAQAKAREADERRRLAEETAQKEIKLRVQAERKAQEIELVALELMVPQVEKLNHVAPDRKVRGGEERPRAGPAKAQPQAGRTVRRDKVTIVFYTVTATLLFIILVGLIFLMIRHYYY
jgi:Flp pilus assembly protein TadB